LTVNAEEFIGIMNPPQGTSMKLASTWPRGRFNGRRITGFTLRLRVDVANWHLLPKFNRGFGQPVAQWLCLALLAEPVYHYLD
jgi:hypothetical protein